MAMIANYFYSLVILIVFCASTAIADDSKNKMRDFVSLSLGYVISLSVHELGHAIVASNVGAKGLSFNMSDGKGVNLLGATTKVKSIEKESILPFAMGGEIGSDFCFEYGLARYRKKPTLLNKSLLFFAGTDFLRYSLYSFYIDQQNNYADPYIVQRETNLSPHIILSIAFVKTLINANRIATHKDLFIPFFTCDKDSVRFNLIYTF